MRLSRSHTLYYLLDEAHHKPVTSVNIILRLRQPENNSITNVPKPVNCFQTPNDVAMWAIVEDCFESTMLKLVGYEASLANIDYDIDEVEDCAIKVSI